MVTAYERQSAPPVSPPTAQYTISRREGPLPRGVPVITYIHTYDIGRFFFDVSTLRFHFRRDGGSAVILSPQPYLYCETVL